MVEPQVTPNITTDPVAGRPLAPVTATWQPKAETDRVDAEAGYYGASRGLALRETFSAAGITERLGGWLGAQDEQSRRAQQRLVFGGDEDLTPDEANARFAVPGRLRFDRPISEPMAAWRQSVAQREAFMEDVVANSDTPWWQLMGAGIAGSVLDPAGLPLWLLPELAAGRALRSATAASRLGALGRIERGALTGAVQGVSGALAYEGVNLWLHNEAADDYDFGSASANIIFGGALGGLAGGVGGWWEGRGARVPRDPIAAADMAPEARTGAFAQALDATIEDRPVDLTPLLVREAEGRASGRMPRAAVEGLDDDLFDASGQGLASMRWLDDPNLPELAVTPRGREVAVRFAVVEADDLISSHDDDLFRNPEYPEDLQPRRRDRAGAQARNRTLEAELNPKRLMTDVGAETGAPIIARDGVVESGNGRTIAIRRAYRTGSPAAARYRAELEGRGLDVAGMDQPVLVRVRQDRLDGAERVALTREMNAEATEAYSPSERATADAEALDDDLLGLIDGPDVNSAANRRFVRSFLDRVAGDDLNRMTTADGRLSEVGQDRIAAALVARAYGDRGLVEALFEATDSQIKAIGRALADAAPEWSGMVAATQRGEVPAELDPTASLTAAVNFVRQVRARRGSVEESMDLIIGQYDAFAGAAMTPETEAFVRMFFRTQEETGKTLWKSPRSAASLAEGLRWLAGEIRKAQPGPNLFGEVADAGTARTLLDGLNDWFARQGDAGPAPGLDFGPDPTAIAGRNVRPDGGPAGREPGRPDAGGPAEGRLEAGKPRVVGTLPRRGVAPAFLGEDGQIYAGKIGSNHLSAASPELREVGFSDVGFVTADGRFLNRVEALAYVNSNGEKIKPSPSMAGELDALDYREQSAFAAKDGDAELYVDNGLTAEGRLEGGKPRVAKGERPAPPKGDPFADPEIEALRADTEAALLRAGLDPADIAGATPAAQDPQTIADAVAAGAFCLKGGG